MRTIEDIGQWHLEVKENLSVLKTNIYVEYKLKDGRILTFNAGMDKPWMTYCKDERGITEVMEYTTIKQAIKELGGKNE